jgi:hypothetical protein
MGDKNENKRHTCGYIRHVGGYQCKSMQYRLREKIQAAEKCREQECPEAWSAQKRTIPTCKPTTQANAPASWAQQTNIGTSASPPLNQIHYTHYISANLACQDFTSLQMIIFFLKIEKNIDKRRDLWYDNGITNCLMGGCSL